MELNFTCNRRATPGASFRTIDYNEKRQVIGYRMKRQDYGTVELSENACRPQTISRLNILYPSVQYSIFTSTWMLSLTSSDTRTDAYCSAHSATPQRMLQHITVN